MSGPVEAETDPAAGTFVAAASLSDIPQGWALKVSVGGTQIALAHCEGRIYALDNSCSHACGPLGDNRVKDGAFLECPWHNSVFDVRTGEPVSGPARKPQRRYEVRVLDGIVYVCL